MEKNGGNCGRFSLSEKHQLGNQKALLSSQSNLSKALLLQKQNVKDNLQLQYFYFLFLNDKNVPLERKKNPVNLQPTFLCTSAPALNRDLCHLIMTDFYPVYFSPSASCPCVIACLTLEVGHPSYWTHLGHYFQCSFMYTIHTINIAVISCSYSAEMTLLP